MDSIRSKIRNIFFVFFLVAWMVSAFNVGKQHISIENTTSKASSEKLFSTPSGTFNNYSLLITAVVGAIQFIYDR